MRQGFVTLLFVTLTMSVFVNPGMMPSRPQPAAVPQQVLTQSPGNQENQRSQVSSLGVCNVEEDPSCSKCSPTQVCPTKELLATIEDFFGPLGKDLVDQDALNGDCEDTGKLLKGTDSKILSRRVWGVPTEVGRRLRFVLATVPDPAHTHLSLFFDRQIESIQQAAQEDGYNFARAYMPWDSNEHPESTDLRTRLFQTEYNRNRERMPGLMIFRKTAPKDLCDAMSPLFVFVAGETPTGGINKGQFTMALRAIKEIRE